MSGTPNIRKEIMEHSNRHNQKGSIKKPWNYFVDKNMRKGVKIRNAM